MDGVTMREAVGELDAVLRADGASLQVLSIDDQAAYIRLAVRFDDVACEECVLPPDALRDMVSSSLRRRSGTNVAVELDDPRVLPPSMVASSGALEVLDPTGVAPEMGEADPGPDAGSLRGKTVAIRHDVLWPSFDWTVEEWTRLLEDAGATVRTWQRVQGLTGDALAEAQRSYDALLSTADIAISGLGNCGSCTSWTVRDAIAAAARGLPTVAIATAHFEPLARLLAADGGRPGLRVVVLPYPYDTLPEGEVRDHARAAFPRLCQTLGAVTAATMA